MMASLPPKALHCLAALKTELLSRGSTAEAAEGAEEVLRGLPRNASAFSASSAVKPEPRRAEVESRQRMRPAKRSKATIASRYYQRRAFWTPVY